MPVLEGKVAIITGAARGQGAAEARLFHAEGAKVVLTDVTEDGRALADELGDGALFLPLDVADEAAWQNVAQQSATHFGGIDILINNAGITGYEPVDAISTAQLQRYMNIHVFGALYGIQAVTPFMEKAGSGAIVNVASTAALRGYPTYLGYGVSKWALRGLTRYASHDLVGRKIRINTILPGGVETPMLMRDDAGTLIDAARAAVPMKRFATAEEIAKVALFLASDASSYMTGADMVVDGGLNA
ncbi:SDR family oxidoreductase [Sphingobium phenoxybenzoativorans]|uniref:SDR family oxidoreductase n=1 Tax=Sphingobium phenoxybenzoativorans TaxID=1592790 RepID=A0A975Q2J3_9SPHN|nr:SDR family oxidoreductase [Sphingobium phenoxybenzoativorans]QUT06746.1 SDR family oxidoreductase [Sphingobium phenoxybenzoativorans]